MSWTWILAGAALFRRDGGFLDQHHRYVIADGIERRHVGDWHFSPHWSDVSLTGLLQAGQTRMASSSGAMGIYGSG